MKKICYIVYLVCLMLAFSMIGSGCSQKEEKTADTTNQITEGAAQDASTTPVAEEVTQPPVEESNSPWKLVSETTVETKVNYAGFLNESVGITVGYEGETSYTEDGGKTWKKSGNVSYCRYGLDWYSEDFVIDSGNGGVNLLSKDNGRTWTYLGSYPLENGNFNKLLSIVDKETIFIGANKKLGVSFDGGNTWEDLELPQDVRKLVGMYFLSKDVGYLLNSDGTLYKTVDGCKTWIALKIDLEGNSVANYSTPAAAINFQDENNGIVIISTKKMDHLCVRTKDGGATWEKVEMPKTIGQSPYLSRDGKYLTLSTATRKITLYKFEE